MELRDYIAVLRRRWMMILAFLLVGIAGGAAITVLTTPQYASTTRLFVSTPVGDTNVNVLQGAQFSSNRMASYANLIEGVTVAQKVIDTLGLTETPSELLGQLSATALPNTVIVEITVTDPSPARAQMLSQTTAEVFSGFVPEWEGSTPEGQAPIQATIVDDAPLPTSPVAPKPTLNIALGALLGLFVGLGLAVLRETLDNTVKSGDMLEGLTEAASLGAILADNDAPKSPLITQIAATSGRAESFRVLRTNLQFVDADKESRIFTITSAVPSEGKSTTSVNLAISLAQSGQRVALLETDLRRPKVAEYLKLEKAVGLTTVLIGRATLDDVIQPWGSDGLDVITSGSVPPNPAELLQSAAFSTVLDELRQRYQIVIADAPPLLPVTDAALVAEQTDGAILIVRFGKTTREQVVGAAGRLGAVGAALLGSVLNFVPAKGSRGYGYGYGYGYYGYGYAPEEPVTRREHRAAEKAEKAAARESKAAGRGVDRAARRDAKQGGRRALDRDEPEHEHLDHPVSSAALIRGRNTARAAAFGNTTTARQQAAAIAPGPVDGAGAGFAARPPSALGASGATRPAEAIPAAGTPFAAAHPIAPLPPHGAATIGGQTHGGRTPALQQRVAAAIQAEEQRALREYQADQHVDIDDNNPPPYAPHQRRR